MIPPIMTFVDIETTGCSITHDRIIEIGIIQTKKGKITNTFKSLINPEIHIPPEITQLTGITARQLESAPRFFDIMDDLFLFFEDTVFVAHNARFDYGFLKHEYLRYEKAFKVPKLCTVKLARNLLPHLRRFTLDHIITAFHIDVMRRHRAFDDAKVLYDFLSIAKEQFGDEIVSQAIELAMKTASLPAYISKEIIHELPEGPGVYVMYGELDTPIYIGKSINIKERVLSHFVRDLSLSIESKLSKQVRRISYQKTTGEFSALLLESFLIKKYHPIYNRLLKNHTKLVLLKKHEKPGNLSEISIEEKDQINIDEIEDIIGVFRSAKQAKEVLKNVAKEHHLCPKLIGLEKGKGTCFWYGLGWCFGACIGKEVPIRYNIRFTQAFANMKLKSWPFPGAIEIREKLNGLYHSFIIDKWCILAEKKSDIYDAQNYQENEYQFDLDTYKIIKRFIGDIKNQKNIRLL